MSTYNRVLKRAYKIFSAPGLAKADNNGYFHREKPDLKAFVEEQLKQLEPTKLIITFCVTQEKPVEYVITLDPEYVEDAKALERAENVYTKIDMPFKILMKFFFESSKMEDLICVY